MSHKDPERKKTKAQSGSENHVFFDFILDYNQSGLYPNGVT